MSTISKKFQEDSKSKKEKKRAEKEVKLSNQIINL